MTRTALAPAPQRSGNSFTLAFGVLNIPLSVYTGVEETRVTRSEFLNADPTIPVGRANVRKDTGAVVDTADVARMAQASNGAYVVLTDDEIAACTCPKGVGDIVTFVPVAQAASAYLPIKADQVRPKQTKGKPDLAGERAFGLLLAAMRKRKVVALVRVALRGPACYALLGADGSFTYVRTADQVREARPLPDTAKYSEAELSLAGALIDAVGTDTPVLTDDTAPAVRAFVESKAKGVAAPAPQAIAPIPLDIMAALSASIDDAKAKRKAKGVAA